MTAVNQIQKEINKLEGIYPVHRVMIQGDKDNPIAVTDSSDLDAINDRIGEALLKATQVQ
jgi:hypothetical protein